MEKVILFDNPEEVVRNYIVPLLKEYSIFCLQGPLGVGKTTLVKEIFRQSGIQEIVNSPTFGYVKNYTCPDGVVFSHFDLYRVMSLEEFIAAGFDEILYRDGVKSFIEWPEIIEPLFKSLHQKVCIFELSYSQTDACMRQIIIKNQKKLIEKD